MSVIEQVYCTHCTYGTSALEQREGELADRVLGYSARAGSQERNDLRNHYRSIERFLYYYLPSDTPPEEKQRLDAAAAPRRLFFCPSMGKLQMVGQVAYRQYDTAERLGSYFAHVLFAEVDGQPWSALDCLRLWNAPWVQEDSPDHPYALPSLARLDDLWAGAAPAVGDDALLRFLQSPSGAAEKDDAVIPSRWRATAVQTRIDLLVNALQGLLALGLPRRESVLLVVEPAIAALAFYGVARLLPKSLAEGLSFSTYEPNADRLPVTLAATTFFDPQNADVRPDLYRRRGLVVNTYQGRLSDSGAPAGNYARFIVERLLEEGWATVERLLENFESSGAKRPEDLEALVPTHRLASRVLSAVPPDDDSWRKSDVAVRYLSREVRHQLATAEAGWPQLRQVIGTPNQLTVLELVASDGVPAELQRPAQFLLKNFPPERIADLVASPFLGRPAKIKALVSYVTSLGQLPEGCHLLAASGVRAATTDPLLPELLAKLPEPVLRRLYETTADAKKMELFAALVGACRSSLPTPGELKRLMLDILTSLSSGHFLEALVRHRDELRACCPPPEPALGRRLGQALYELPAHPKTFEKWLSALDAWKGYFPFPNLAERRLAEWAKVRACLLALRDRGGEPDVGRVERLKNRLRPPTKANFQPLAEALRHAMPPRTSELDELAEVAERCALTVPQFKERLELVAKSEGFTLRFGREPADTPANDHLFGGPGGEMELLRRHREQQARLHQLFRELQEQLLVYADDSMGHRKLDAVQQIGQVLVGRPDFLADGKQKMEDYFFNKGRWPTASAIATGKSKRGFKLRKKRSKWIPAAAVAASIAVFVPLLGYGYLSITGRASTKVTSKAATGKPSASDTASTSENETRNARPAGAQPSTSSQNQQSTPTASNRSTSNKPAKPPRDKPIPTVDTADESDSSAPVTGSTPSGPPASMDNAAPAAEVAGKVDPKPASDNSPPRMGDNDSRNKPDVATAAPDPGVDDPEPKQPIFLFADEGPESPLPNGGLQFTTPISLKSWPAVPAEITLTLHGLEAANALMEGGNQLVQRLESTTEHPPFVTLTVALESGGAETDRSSTLLAKFVAEKQRLSFEWCKVTSESNEVRTARQWIRHCVLEIGGADPVLMTLAAPHREPPLSLKNEGTSIDVNRSEAKENGQETELVLGGGQINLQSRTRLSFDGFGGANPYVLRDLPNDCEDAAAVVELVHQENKGWEVRITGLNRQRTAMLNDTQKRGRFNSDLERLFRLSNNTQISDPKSETKPAEVKELVARLARILDVADEAIPHLRHADDGKERKEFKKSIDRAIIAPARRLKKQLDDLEWLRRHAEKLSAVIYRRVDKNIYVRHIVFGDPESPRGNQAPDETGGEDL
jgi:hypothetical protein